MGDPLTQEEVFAKMFGGGRSADEMAKDGARATISQIDKLRRQLDQAERSCQHVATTGKIRKDDAAIWKRVARAADKLLEGMVA
jgi:hypothetical protein